MRSSPRAASGPRPATRAAVRRAVAVRRREVEVGERRQRVPGAVERVVGAPRRRVERVLRGLRDELVARAEVLVEAPVRQPGRRMISATPGASVPDSRIRAAAIVDDPLVVGLLLVL